MAFHLWIPKKLTKLDLFKASYAPGRKANVSPGAHMTDIAHLRQTALLCSFCETKFRQIANRHGYRKVPFDAEGNCDDCRRGTTKLKVYAHESNWNHHVAPHPDGGHGRYGEIDRALKPKWNPFRTIG